MAPKGQKGGVRGGSSSDRSVADPFKIRADAADALPSPRKAIFFLCVCVVVYRVVLGPSSFAISGEVPLREHSYLQNVQGLSPP